MTNERSLDSMSRSYVMSAKESARWDSGAGHERRDFLKVLSDHLASSLTLDDECTVLFYHADGQFLAKSVLHKPLFAGS